MKFTDGIIVRDGAALEATRESRGWLEQHKAQQDILWLEYMKFLRASEVLVSQFVCFPLYPKHYVPKT